MEKLFVYGTLRDPIIQRKAFGRVTPGQPSVLKGFKKKYVYLHKEPYPAIIPEPKSATKGLLLHVSPQELHLVDDWEDAIYTREMVRLENGVYAWAYVYREENKIKPVRAALKPSEPPHALLHPGAARRRLRLNPSALRNVIFGVEDSLVSTVGLLSGVAIAAVPRSTVILTGVVLIFVEAFSMGAGAFLSEASAKEFIHKRDASAVSSFRLGVTMFVSYFLSGFIPLAPYAVLDVARAFPLSIIVSLLALFGLGLWGGSVSRINILRSGLRMFLVGGLAILIGISAGWLVNGGI